MAHLLKNFISLIVVFDDVAIGKERIYLMI